MEVINTLGKSMCANHPLIPADGGPLLVKWIGVGVIQLWAVCIG